MGQPINAANEPIYKGILPPVWNGVHEVRCDPCTMDEVSAGLNHFGRNAGVLRRNRTPTVYLALSAITWVGACPECGQQYYADLARWPRGRACD